jgi:hypothetical protein
MEPDGQIEENIQPELGNQISLGGKMRFRKPMLLVLALLWSFSAYAQQAPQPLTFWSEYAVKPGKEEEFVNLVKTVGQPVRDKLMADGVVLGWGLETSILRGHDVNTHAIWYSVADWSGIEKVQTAMGAQLAKLAAEDAKAAEEGGKKGKKGGMTTADRLRDAVDLEKTKDYLTRDLVFAAGGGMPPAGALPFVRYNYVKVKPGKGAAYRSAWDKYNKPVLDKLLADGTILAYGLSVEEVKTTAELTHFTWYAVKGLGDLEKVRSAFVADRDRRSQEEREAITETFTKATDPDASRSEVDRHIIFHLPGQK